jgi:hypothetical protein
LRGEEIGQRIEVGKLSKREIEVGQSKDNSRAKHETNMTLGTVLLYGGGFDYLVSAFSKFIYLFIY